MKENYKNNKKKYIKRNMKWQKENPEKRKRSAKIYSDKHKGEGWKREKKIRNNIIKLKGSKCAVCGYDKLPALQFHHLYKKDSKDDFLRKDYDLNKIILICANCHCLIHNKKKGER